MLKWKKIAIVLSCLLVSSSAFAGTGFYAELSAGQADNSIETNYTFTSTTNSYGTITEDNESGTDKESLGKSTSFGARLGHQFNDYIAVELGHHEYGEYNDEDSSKINTSSTSVGVKGILPLSESFALFARVGYAKWNFEAKFTDDGFSDALKYDDNDIYYGIGAEYHLTESISLGLEYSVLEMSWGNSITDEFSSEDFSYSYASNINYDYKVENIALLFKYTF